MQAIQLRRSTEEMARWLNKPVLVTLPSQAELEAEQEAAMTILRQAQEALVKAQKTIGDRQRLLRETLAQRDEAEADPDPELAKMW